MALERELKYSVADGFVPGIEELTSAFAGSTFRVLGGKSQSVYDRYLDDAVGNLRRGGLALRTRSVDGASLATLKSAGTTDGALHERDELELPMQGDTLPQLISHRITAETELERLRPRVELRTERVLYSVEQEGAVVATLSFDAVEARRPDGPRAAHFHEVEIEATGNTSRAVLEAIAERLQTLLPLTANSTSKLERAEALLLLYGD